MHCHVEGCRVCDHLRTRRFCVCLYCVHYKRLIRCLCAECRPDMVHGENEWCGCAWCNHRRGYPHCLCVVCEIHGAEGAEGMEAEGMEAEGMEAEGVEEPKMCFCNMPFLEALPPLPDDLRCLCCAETGIRELPPLPASLRILDVTGCPLQRLPDLPPRLRSLRTRMDLTNVELPPRLRHLILPRVFGLVEPQRLPARLPDGLVQLVVSRGQVERLPPLPDSLKDLYVGDNSLRELPPLPAGLQHLDIRDNPLQVLPRLPVGLRTLNLLGLNLVEVALLPPQAVVIFNPVEDEDAETSQRILRACSDWTLSAWLERYEEQASTRALEVVISELIERSYRRCVERCRAIKEELMINRWHPRRIGPLIEAGWDVEDI
jgi:hypothetical protein